MNKSELLTLKNQGYLTEEPEGVTIVCPKCGAVKYYKYKTSLRNIKAIHSISCSIHYQDLIKQELGEDACRKFASTYRHAKERCTNPRSKDYDRYKGLWGFTDYVDYHKACYPNFKQAWETNSGNLTIDRIDGSRGYEVGNVRFISMGDNLRNKPNVKAVKATNVKTNEVLSAPSLGKLASDNKKVFKSLSALHSRLIKGGLYKNTWLIEYL